MPDDSVKHITFTTPTTPVNEHPQNVVIHPRNRRRQKREKREDEQGREGWNWPNSPIPLEDKVTLTLSENDVGRIETKGEEKGIIQDNHTEDVADLDKRRIDIKV